MTAQVEKLARVGNTLFGKVYELSLTKNYVANWGMVQAVRELIQNSLDSESPFVYEFFSENDDTGLFGLRLNSEFTVLTPQTLLLGSTSKRDSDDAIGQHGEGYKIALLVLTRLGYSLDLLNGDLLWRPRFRYSRAFGDELLVVEESVSPNRTNKGLTFIVHGLNETEVAEVRASCLRMQDNIGAIKSTKYGEILLDQPAKLYVGSLYICDTELKHGYNILPKYIKLERDRQTVDSYDLKDTTLKMWYDTGETERIAKMISEEVPDVEYSRYGAPELVKEECYRIFRENHPDSIIASSPEEAKQKIKDGLIKTVYVGGGMYSAVSSSPSYRAEQRAYTPKPVVAPWKELTTFLSVHRSQMRTSAIVAFKELIRKAEKEWLRK